MSCTRIDWADEVWNPVWGCVRGCSYCYARGYAKRFGKRVCGRNDFQPTWIEKNYQRKFRRDSRYIFVNSMSDPVYWKIAWLAGVFARIAEFPKYRFLFLTKSPGIYAQFPWTAENIWFGATATNENEVSMYQALLRPLPGIRFLSIEPIMTPIASRFIDCDAINWIIVGAETGKRRGKVIPCQDWLREIRGFAQAHYIPLFFKESLRPFWPTGTYFPQEYPAWRA